MLQGLALQYFSLASKWYHAGYKLLLLFMANTVQQSAAALEKDENTEQIICSGGRWRSEERGHPLKGTPNPPFYFFVCVIQLLIIYLFIFI